MRGGLASVSNAIGYKLPNQTTQLSIERSGKVDPHARHAALWDQLGGVGELVIGRLADQVCADPVHRIIVHL